MNDVIRSKEFDDVYFSVDDGLAESRYVFLEGNNLAARFKEKKNFVIAETGFGTGLNFLAAWEEFEKISDNGQSLHFLSFEKYPLSKDEIRKALSRWSNELGEKIEHMLNLYPLRIAGVHRIYVTDKVILTLVFDDINDAIPKIEAKVDAWFLDGFNPAKNPEMWSEVVFTNMARLSINGASFSTFTAAGFVKRGLSNVGFKVEKRKGYGRKRESLRGFIKNDNECYYNNDGKKIAVIGGGLAGCASAYILAKRGLYPVIFEACEDIAAGASGNICGLYNPRLSALRNVEADFYMSAYADTYNIISNIKSDIEFNPCGNLHLLNDDKKRKRYTNCIKNWAWNKEHMELLPARNVKEISGIELYSDGLFLFDGGSVSPKKLCNAFADNIDVRLSCVVENLKKEDGFWIINGEKFDYVVLACAAGVLNIDISKWLPVYSIRGQVSVIKSTEKSKKLNVNIGYGGYVTKEYNNIHVVGATFDRKNKDVSVLNGDNYKNLEELSKYISYFDEEYNIIGAKAGLRCSSDDYFPIIGKLPDYCSWKNLNDNYFEGVYVSCAHGSHGIVSSIAGANIIADMICGDVISEYINVIDALCASRFLKRMRKRELL